MSTATEWLTKLATDHTRHEAEKVEWVIVNHFGSAGRALEMVKLFPGRYSIGRSGDSLFFGPSGSVRYTLVDALRPIREANTR